ncbi:MAG: ribulose-phosphate 3-epimerase [Candidatus Thermoplasmatota archaeon]|nr:ribulose-phosphate 3-epimerase [Candidatus Thermoplasmatota archaeon]
MVLVAPSILSADFSRLGEEIREVAAAGADWIHIDVMDGHFVPNLTIGPVVVQHLRPLTDLTFDVHLMIERPEDQVEAFVRAGADIITVHAESTRHLHNLVSMVKERCRVGVALNPATPLHAVEHVLDDIHLLLIMTVNPGYGGQVFISSLLPKIRAAKALIGTRKVLLQVDGGIKPENVERVKKAEVDVVVAGSAVFGSSDYEAVIKRLK